MVLEKAAQEARAMGLVMGLAKARAMDLAKEMGLAKARAVGLAKAREMGLAKFQEMGLVLGLVVVRERIMDTKERP